RDAPDGDLDDEAQPPEGARAQAPGRPVAGDDLRGLHGGRAQGGLRDAGAGPRRARALRDPGHPQRGLRDHDRARDDGGDAARAPGEARPRRVPDRARAHGARVSEARGGPPVPKVLMISSDCHAGALPATYNEYMPKRFHEAANAWWIAHAREMMSRA